MNDDAELCHECDDEDCLICHALRERLEHERYADAQVAYYAPGGPFDILFDGAFDESKEKHG